MLKKILMAGFVFITSSSIVFANGAPYVGASVGVIANTSKNVNVNNYVASNYRGVPLSVFAGYGGVINGNFYLGAEVTGTIGVAELNDNGLKTSYGYGVSALPGFMLCDHTMTFARIGVLSSRFPRQNESRAGLQLGLGIQTGLTQNVDLRGEYDYVNYRSIPVSTINNVTHNVSPRSDQVNLALVYKFD